MRLAEDLEEFASHIVTNAYDALEQGASAAITARGDEIPMQHDAEIQGCFELLDANKLESCERVNSIYRDAATVSVT